MKRFGLRMDALEGFVLPEAILLAELHYNVLNYERLNIEVGEGLALKEEERWRTIPHPGKPGDTVKLIFSGWRWKRTDKKPVQVRQEIFWRFPLRPEEFMKNEVLGRTFKAMKIAGIKLRNPTPTEVKTASTVFDVGTLAELFKSRKKKR